MFTHVWPLGLEQAPPIIDPPSPNNVRLVFPFCWKLIMEGLHPIQGWLLAKLQLAANMRLSLRSSRQFYSINHHGVALGATPAAKSVNKTAGLLLLINSFRNYYFSCAGLESNHFAISLRYAIFACCFSLYENFFWNKKYFLRPLPSGGYREPCYETWLS